MKNVKMDEKSKFMSAVLLSIVLIGLAFFFGYKKFEDKATQFNNDNAALEQRIKSLEQYYITEEQNRADTETMTKAIADVFSQYPGDARFEDGIFEAFNLYGASGNTLEFESIGFSQTESVKNIPLDTVVAAGIEGYNEMIDFNKFDVVYRGKLTYEGLKGTVEEISNGDYNLAIGNMTYSVADDGYIQGSTMLSFYSVAGVGAPYTEPPVEEYQTGLANLFGVSAPVIESTEED
jgi:Tfp pilus assembly protein PilO